MKIVQLVTQMEAGGAQRAAILLSAGLRARGHEVETWFLYLKRLAFHGTPGMRVLLERRPSLLDTCTIPPRLVLALRAYAPDVLITHTHYANVIGQVAAQICRIPRRIAVQQNPVDSYPRFARLADYIFGALKTYSDVVAVSKSVADSAQTYPTSYRRKIKVVHNAVSSPSADTQIDDVRAEYGLPIAVPLLVNVGRLAYQKNQRTLVEAVAKLPDVHLAILGEGELRESLESLTRALGLEDRVHLLGELPWGDAISITRTADLFVFPSHFEGLSLALVEAMSLGLPVVASDIPPNREALQDAGILVSPQSADDLARTIGRVLADPALAQQMRSDSRQRAEAFSLRKMADGYEELLA
jgi:glycosyltransferase involved in cell wall biosynthesis